jgi:hypothetical protein
MAALHAHLDLVPLAHVLQRIARTSAIFAPIALERSVAQHRSPRERRAVDLLPVARSTHFNVHDVSAYLLTSRLMPQGGPTIS